MVFSRIFIALWLQFAVSRVQCLQCYYCHQTTVACNDGNVGKLQMKDCAEHCLTFKYETNISGRMVLATVRGCLEDPEFRPENKEMRKTILRTVCNQSRCNNSTTIKFMGILLLGTIILLYKNLYF